VMLDPFKHPGMFTEGYTQTSERDVSYNCIAWAANDNKRWWWPSEFAYWPKNAPRTVKLKSFTLAFKTLGYVPCSDGNFETNYEKIAVYAKDGVPKHAARQLDNGMWTHKMGQNIDLSATLTAAEGPEYGEVVRLYRRKTTIAQKAK
jgi:hypothetical protein